MLQIRQVTKRLGRHDALSGLQLEIAAGEVFGLLGPNGAGKTTLIRLVMGLLQQRAAEVLRMVELEQRRDDVVATLSGGMIRRTMLATALVHRPRLLLDEPTAGVDPLLRIRFWEWFRQMVGEGTSIIVSTHNLSEAVPCTSTSRGPTPPSPPRRWGPSPERWTT